MDRLKNVTTGQLEGKRVRGRHYKKELLDSLTSWLGKINVQEITDSTYDSRIWTNMMFGMDQQQKKEEETGVAQKFGSGF